MGSSATRARAARTALVATTTLCAVALAGGTGLVAASASTSLAPTSPRTMASPPPADCSTDLSTPQSTSGGTPLATKAFQQSVVSGTTTTYFFTITSSRQAGNSSPSYSNLEDCAYANGNPSNIKYGVEAANPPFSNGQVTTTLTVDSTDSICDRVVIDGTLNGTPFTDYTNLVGSSGGKADPSACAPSTNLAEMPAGGMIALAGVGLAGAAAFVWRRREQPLVVTEPG